MTTKKRRKNKSNRCEMTFLEHLEELRWRLIKCIITIVVTMIGSFPFSKYILHILTLPNNRLITPAKLIFLKPTGMLMVRVTIALVTGLIISSPVILYQLWKFISPGLLESEKRYIWPVIFFSTLCFLVGVVFSYFVMIPFILPFLYSLATENIEPTLNISEYIGFVTRLILVTGLIFELPTLSFFFTRVGILTPRILRRYRRYAVVLTFIAAAILTPPDPVSQLLLAGPLLLLYEISVLVSALAQRARVAGSQK
ncbi:twin-arginine translocase subunit TatC [candidate division KSB1 bacterium]|nr:MAG: twin arginine-targeting protein translocase TatC [candidate division KSB1 bacterium 4484_219]RKY74962.1 MAG: twin-arginine translocase subunit TatC [candidate division KSB1 bacterium]RKY89493.1 MAG: twin-arginine translocase subunit TatC [candidate division KSB1 bacterium]HDI51708.1 twin-arginine translocase subunit TatC [Bacteroidota bacterium]